MFGAFLIAAAGADALGCAALWRGYGDLAAVSAFLSGEAEARQSAEAFRDMALTEGVSAAEADAAVAARREGMFLLVRAAVEGGDAASLGLFERQMLGCDGLLSGQ